MPLRQKAQAMPPAASTNSTNVPDHVLEVLLDGRADEAERGFAATSFVTSPLEAEGIDLLSKIFEQLGQRERALELLGQASNIGRANPDYDAETRSLMRERMTVIRTPSGTKNRAETRAPGDSGEIGTLGGRR